MISTSQYYAHTLLIGSVLLDKARTTTLQKPTLKMKEYNKNFSIVSRIIKLVHFVDTTRIHSKYVTVMIVTLLTIFLSKYEFKEIINCTNK